MMTDYRLAVAGIALLGLAGLVLAGCSSGESDAPTATGTAGPSGGHTVVVAVDGMTCEGCVGTVTAALEELPGVESVDVSLAEKQAEVVGPPDKVTEQAVIQAIQQAGYEVPSPETNAESPG